MRQRGHPIAKRLEVLSGRAALLTPAGEIACVRNDAADPLRELSEDLVEAHKARMEEAKMQARIARVHTALDHAKLLDKMNLKLND